MAKNDDHLMVVMPEYDDDDDVDDMVRKLL